MPRQLVAHSQRSERVGWPSGRRTQLDCRAYVAPPEKAEVKEEKKFNIVADVPSQPGGKQRVVVLGSGWGAASFVKALTKHASSKYEVILISPRNYFLYTPLLPAVATGTMEERSIVEPIRNMIVDKGDYYEAIAQDIDVKNKSLVCCFPADRGFREACFRVSYDMLVLAVGSVNNTFGIQGVEQHAFFFKSINDANRLRRQVSECFERAALPQTPPEERKQLLSFVVVGGGPTGVEVAAELYDMITDDLKRLYPKLMPDVNIYLIELMDHILSAYDRAISDYTAKHFRRNGIQLVLNSRVQSVSEGCVDVVDKDKNTSSIKFGACVWATGVAMNPLNKKLQEQIPGQTHFRSIITDRYLRVNGSDGSIFAIGDAATIEQNRALEYADKLFHKADVNGDGVLSVEEVRDALTKASKEFPQFNEHARFLEGRGRRKLRRWVSGLLHLGAWEPGGRRSPAAAPQHAALSRTGAAASAGGVGGAGSRKYGPKRFGGLVGDFMKQQKVPTDAIADDFSELTGEECLDEDSWRELIAKIDSGLRGLPATAQVARQEGEYLASIFDKHSIVAGMDFEGKVAPFEYNHKGALAYVGQDRAVMDVPDVGPLWGYGPGLAWKGFETISQFSFRNFCLVALDWTRTKVFGRDISRV